MKIQQILLSPTAEKFLNDCQTKDILLICIFGKPHYEKNIFQFKRIKMKI